LAEPTRTITALRDARHGRVAVELDGSPWRVLPVDVVVRSRLAEGRELDRPALRLLRRELRRAEALAVAGRALRRRDLSEQRLAQRLERAAVAPAASEAALEALGRSGLVDDARFARSRAEALAGRRYGDAAIRHDLASQGVAPELVDAAVAGLEPEPDRAAEIARASRGGVKVARYLAAKGFSEDAVERALGQDFANDP
jgi:SOS response regulatory protein OraA/RecX